jgi:protein tyrosine/serine phosphatase
MKKMNLKTNLILCLVLFNISVYSQTADERPSNWAKKISNSKLSNLYEVNDSIYRCEQPDSLDFIQIHRIGIKSIMNLRSNFTDKDLIDGLPLFKYNVKMLPFNFGDKEIVTALRIINRSPKPILVHCLLGSDRTGVIIAMYRIVYQKWTKEEALNEMINGGYSFHNIFMNIPHYIKSVDIARLKIEISNTNLF